MAVSFHSAIHSASRVRSISLSAVHQMVHMVLHSTFGDAEMTSKRLCERCGLALDDSNFSREWRVHPHENHCIAALKSALEEAQNERLATLDALSDICWGGERGWEIKGFGLKEMIQVLRNSVKSRRERAEKAEQERDEARALLDRAK